MLPLCFLGKLWRRPHDCPGTCCRLVTHRRSYHIHQCRVITWPAATNLPSLCQRNLLKSNKGSGIILRPGAHHKHCHRGPAINIDAITCSTCRAKLRARGWNPSRYSSILPVYCLLFLLTFLMPCYWLSPGLWAKLGFFFLLTQSVLSIAMRDP